MNGIYAMNVPQLEQALIRAQHKGAITTVRRIEQELKDRCSEFCCGKQAAAA